MLRTRFAPRNDAAYWLDRRMTYVHMRHPLDPHFGRSTELLYHRWMLGWTRRAMPGDQSRVLAMHVTARPERLVSCRLDHFFSCHCSAPMRVLWSSLQRESSFLAPHPRHAESFTHKPLSLAGIVSTREIGRRSWRSRHSHCPLVHGPMLVLACVITCFYNTWDPW